MVAHRQRKRQTRLPRCEAVWLLLRQEGPWHVSALSLAACLLARLVSLVQWRCLSRTNRVAARCGAVMRSPISLLPQGVRTAVAADGVGSLTKRKVRRRGPPSSHTARLGSEDRRTRQPRHMAGLPRNEVHTRRRVEAPGRHGVG